MSRDEGDKEREAPAALVDVAVLTAAWTCAGLSVKCRAVPLCCCGWRQRGRIGKGC